MRYATKQALAQAGTRSRRVKSADFFIPRGTRQRANADFLAVLEFGNAKRASVVMSPVESGRKPLLSAAKKAVGRRRVAGRNRPQERRHPRFAKLIVSRKSHFQARSNLLFDARRIKAEAVVGEELEIEVT